MYCMRYIATSFLLVLLLLLAGCNSTIFSDQLSVDQEIAPESNASPADKTLPSAKHPAQPAVEDLIADQEEDTFKEIKKEEEEQVISSPSSLPSGSGGSGGSSGSTSSSMPSGAGTDPSYPSEEFETGPSNLVVWANDGGEKVMQHELRGSQNNSIFDGLNISLFGAHNEVVSFNLILESAAGAGGVSVNITSFSGPGTISNTADSDVLNFIGQNIELFYVRYLQIKGLSSDLSYDVYDERHIPSKCQSDSGNWADRPCANKYFPDIAVPIELHPSFDIAAGTNQAIWGDIYIPKDAPSGNYTAQIFIAEQGVLTRVIPVHLEVLDFELPDLPAARTMLFIERDNLFSRYGTDSAGALPIIKKHFQLAHRHKISLIDSFTSIDNMDRYWVSALDGSLFSTQEGYYGIGKGTGNNVYSIGTYSSWNWKNKNESVMWQKTDEWVNWFDSQDFSTETDYFLYLIDESSDYAKIEKWAAWIKNNPGPGKRLFSFATLDLPSAAAHVPSLSITASWFTTGITVDWENLAGAYKSAADQRFYLYNGNRPASGSFATEDDGMSLRALSWAQYKKGIDRWFFWESTYYNDFQSGAGQINVFQQARTFGDCCRLDSTRGETGWNYCNGDGVLFYPGTDVIFPEESYGLEGPIASLRMKLWRRGIQDVDYLSLAYSKDPASTQQIINRMIPQVLWEYGVSDPADPTWVMTDLSWSIDPDDWEQARRELAGIILD